MSNKQLEKNIGFSAAISLVVGMVIGAGVFFKPYAVFGATQAPGLGILAWVLGAILSIAGGLTAAEVSAAIPKTGGMVAYLRETYGEVWGYLLGWCQSVVYFPATMAALAVIFGIQVCTILNIPIDTYKVPVAIGTILFLVVMNCVSSKMGGILQTVATVCKLIPLVVIIIVGFMKGTGGAANLAPMVTESTNVATGLGAALIATLFAYDGWINVGAIAGEMKNPGKDLPKAIVLGLALVATIYILINIAFLYVMPASELAATETPASAVANIIFGSAGGKVITVGIMISIFGALNGYIMTGMRIPYSMAVENKLPFSSFLGKLHPKFNTPVNSAIAMTLLAIAFALSGQFNMLTDLVIFVIWIFYVMTFFAVFVLRKNRPELPRPYKVPLYPVVPAIAVIGGLYVIINTMISQPLNAGLGLGATLIGLPVYFILKPNFKSVEEN